MVRLPAVHPAPAASLLAGLLLCALALPPTGASAQTCQARSPDRQALLVELYTSEGCNSCPPADRWLSLLKGAPAQPPVLAVAFHVDYWDRLGWVDRFGSARHTERQAEQQRSSGARFSYTPQVLVNGRDWRGWPTLPVLDAPALVRIDLRRQDAQQVTASITPLRGAPARLALWWAVLEDDHSSAVGAGENHGATLRHDHVVRQYGRVAVWGIEPGASAAHDERLMASPNGEGGRKARLLVVVTDAVTGAPLQAAQLTC